MGVASTVLEEGYKSKLHREKLERQKRVQRSSILLQPRRHTPTLEAVAQFVIRHHGRKPVFTFQRVIPRKWSPIPKDMHELDRIFQETCRKYFVSDRELRGPRGSRRLTEPRHEFFYRAYMETKHSSPEIAAFCKRDHTSVIHGKSAHAKRNNLPEPTPIAKSLALEKLGLGA